MVFGIRSFCVLQLDFSTTGEVSYADQDVFGQAPGRELSENVWVFFSLWHSLC